jgi:hypothetical protein
MENEVVKCIPKLVRMQRIIERAIVNEREDSVCGYWVAVITSGGSNNDLGTSGGRVHSLATKAHRRTDAFVAEVE